MPYLRYALYIPEIYLIYTIDITKIKLEYSRGTWEPGSHEMYELRQIFFVGFTQCLKLIE